jgi:hypothetical protein
MTLAKLFLNRNTYQTNHFHFSGYFQDLLSKRNTYAAQGEKGETRLQDGVKESFENGDFRLIAIRVFFSHFLDSSLSNLVRFIVIDPI